MPDEPSQPGASPDESPKTLAVAVEDVAHAVEYAMKRMDERQREETRREKEKADAKERLTNRVSIAAICLTMLMSFLNFARAERDNAATDERSLAAKAKSDADADWAYYQTRSAERSSYVLADDNLRRDTSELPDSDPRVRVAGAHHAEYLARIAAIDRANRELFFVIEELERQRIQHLRNADEIDRKVNRYDMGTRVLTLAVVLLSVTLLANRKYLFWVGVGVAFAGAAVAINGYFLIV